MNISDLKTQFTGVIILPGDPNYELASTAFVFKGSPAIIVQPKNDQDALIALQYAHENKLLLSIRSGGHSSAGFGTNNDGMVIDLSFINKIEIIDEVNQIVKIGTGAKWGDVAKKLQEKGLAITSGDTKTVGVGGLILGGGIGWMVRKYGFTIDNLVGATIVTANGKILHISEKENADLFWAIRGGGGNFGIVLSFELKAQSVSEVYFGNIMYGLENLATVLKGWRDYVRKSDELLTTTFMIMPAFPNSPAGIMILFCYGGNNEVAANKAIEPLKKLGIFLNASINKIPYADVLQDAHAPDGIQIIVKSTFVEDFTDELIHQIETTHGKDANRFLIIRHIGGAINKVPATATAFAYRKSEVLLFAPMFVPLTATSEEITKAGEPWNKIAKYGKGAYSNFLSTTLGEDIKAIYPEETYNRLVEVKKKYDPENLFSQNYNVKP
jgi:FAD/FMN-containing dehydrogenase